MTSRMFESLGLMLLLAVTWVVLISVIFYGSSYPQVYRVDMAYATLDSLGFISTTPEIKEDAEVTEEVLLDTIVTGYEEGDVNLTRKASEVVLSNIPESLNWNYKIVDNKNVFLEEGEEPPLLADVMVVRKRVATKKGDIELVLSLW